jgi:NTP pyrophosphatase (non-canonical NTP hydrolase)
MTEEPMPENTGLTDARSRAREVRELYETLEQRLLGRTWTLPELAIGFTNDAAYVGRLVLAAERTWDIDGDTDAELRHKLAECLWWVFVLADRLDVDLPEAYESTMDRIGAGLTRAVEGR